jgi:predicted short-subunit dehydrogenase-like oxidoreductase (DUF2520 family)
MDIVIIGSGNVATVLAKKMKTAGHHILQVVGRNASTGNALASTLGSEFTQDWSGINKNADVYLIAVNDKAIKEVSEHLHLPGKIIVHTAGAVSKEILKNTGAHYGVFYPLQSLNKEKTDIQDIPIHIDASDVETFKVLEKLAASISKNVWQAGDEERLKLHVAAVFCNNFTNYMYAMAEEYCKKENLDFNLLKPLIKETAEKAMDASPFEMQTGPAARGDELTIQKHLQVLESYPHLQQLYRFITGSIRDKYA